MSDLDVGTLTGRVEIEDQLSSGLELIMVRVEKFAEEFDGALGAVAIGAGAAIAAIGAMTATIIALGNQGSQINELAASFDRLSGSTETADGIMRAMQAGTANTMTDFQLMTEASKLLQSGVTASASTFGTLTAAARILSKEGFGSLPDVLQQVDRGMQTGLLRGPLLKSLHLDLTAVEDTYARSIGLTSSELTKQQKLAADRAAILTSLNGVVAHAGEVELSFQERMMQGATAIKNWGEALAASVASSPNIMRAVDAIAQSLAVNFGGVGKTAIETLTNWINKFADLVTQYAPPIISFVAQVARGVRDFATTVVEWVTKISTGVVEIYTKVKQYWDAVPEWFQHIAESAAVAGVAVLGTNAAFDVISGPSTLSMMANLAQIWSVVGSKIGLVTGAVMEFGSAVASFGLGEAIAAWMPGLVTVSSELLALATGPIGLLVGALTALSLGVHEMTGSWKFLTGPLGDAWSIMKDVADIAISLGTGALKGIEDVLGGIADKARSVIGWFEEINTWAHRLGISFGESSDGVKHTKEELEALSSLKPDFGLLTVSGGTLSSWHQLAEDMGLVATAARQMSGRITLPEVVSPSGIHPFPASPYGPGAPGIGGGEGPTAAQLAESGPSIASTAATLLPAVQAELDKLRGDDIAKRLREIDAAVAAMGDTTKMGRFQLEELGKELDDAAAHGGILSTRLSELRIRYVDQFNTLYALVKTYPELIAVLDKTTFSAKTLSGYWLDATKVMEQAAVSQHAAGQAALSTQIALQQGIMNSSMASFDQQTQAASAYYDLLRQKEQDDYDFSVITTNKKFAVLIEGVNKQTDGAKDLIDSYIKQRDAELKALDANKKFADTKTDIDQLNDAVHRLHDRYGDTLNDLARMQHDAGQTYANMISLDNLSVLATGRHLFSVQQLDVAYQKWTKTVLDTFNAVHPLWQKAVDDLETLGGEISSLGQNSGSALISGLGAAVTGIGKLTSAWRDAIAMRAAYAANRASGTGPTGPTSGPGGTFASGAIGAVGIGSSSSDIGSGIVNLGASAAVSAVTMATLTTATVATSVALGAATFGIGLIVLGIGAWIKSSQHAAEVQKSLGQQLDDLHTAIINAYGSGASIAQDATGKLINSTDSLNTALGNAQSQAQRFGLSLADATGGNGKHSTEDLQRVQNQLDALAAILKEVDADAQHLGLTWADMNKKDAFTAATKAADALVRELDLMTRAGYNVDAVTKAMAPDVNAWLASALKAGIQIPASMQPIIQALINTHQLTEDNARAMLGLAADTTPSLQDITDAASRYGLKLDELGSKVTQIKITDQANQVVKDFNTLEAAGADFNQIMKDSGTIASGVQFSDLSDSAQKAFLDAGGSIDDFNAMLKDAADGTAINFDSMSVSMQQAFLAAGGTVEGMRSQIQDMVLQSIGPLGIELPESMKPIIQKMIDAGDLVDGTGQKMTDMGNLKFAKPIGESIDDLTAALNRLVGALTGTNPDSVTSNLDDMSTTAIDKFGNVITKGVKPYADKIGSIGATGGPLDGLGSATASTSIDLIGNWHAATTAVDEYGRHIQALPSGPSGPGPSGPTSPGGPGPGPSPSPTSVPSPTPTVPAGALYVSGSTAVQVSSVATPVILQVGTEVFAKAVVTTLINAGLGS